MSDQSHAKDRESVLLPEDHSVDTGHVYDGIAELDHRLPAWWLMTLWGAIAFSIVYWAYYHTTGEGPTSRETYLAEKADVDALAKAKEEKLLAGLDDDIRTLAKDPAALERGKTAYMTNCLACHRADGGGLVGPNLTDGFTLHGASPSAMFKVVSEGVLVKGMPAWKPVLGVEKIRDVIAFLTTLPPAAAGKEPQGNPTDGAAPPPAPTPAEGAAVPVEGAAVPVEGGNTPPAGGEAPKEG